MKSLLTQLAKCSLLLLALVVVACRQAPPVQGFDQETWLSDPDGCKGLRAQVWQKFEPQKNNLLGYDENHLKQLLGMPASKNLFEKGQKIYSYPISGFATCAAPAPPRTLQVRINVTGKVSELMVVKE